MPLLSGGLPALQPTRFAALWSCLPRGVHRVLVRLLVRIRQMLSHMPQELWPGRERLDMTNRSTLVSS